MSTHLSTGPIVVGAADLDRPGVVQRLRASYDAGQTVAVANATPGDAERLRALVGHDSPAQWSAAVPRAALDALTVNQGDHVWDLTRLGWALHGPVRAMTVPIGEFTDSDVGSVVVWNHDAARTLFDALASDDPVPAALDGQQ